VQRYTLGTTTEPGRALFGARCDRVHTGTTTDTLPLAVAARRLGAGCARARTRTRTHERLRLAVATNRPSNAKSIHCNGRRPRIVLINGYACIRVVDPANWAKNKNTNVGYHEHHSIA
jgi:hypothetical protein